MTSTTARGASLAADAKALGPWFHNLRLPDGTQTAPRHPLGDFPRFKWEPIGEHLPDDLTGWTALDVGCNAGYYSFELARRGAHVTGIDLDPRYLRQARWAAGALGLEHRVAFERKQVYDLAHDEREFDLVLFLGVFYHLRYPLLGLDAVAQRVRRRLVFQSLTLPGDAAASPREDARFDERHVLLEEGWPRMAFVEHAFAGDPTNWWVPSHAGVQAMLRSAGLRVVDRVDDETYVCEPDSGNPSTVATWNASEFLSATGREWRDADDGDGGPASTKFRATKGTLESAGHGD